jgi:hypothetical protein
MRQRLLQARCPAARPVNNSVQPAPAAMARNEYAQALEAAMAASARAKDR